MANRKKTIEQIMRDFSGLKHNIMSETQHIWQATPITPAQGHVVFLVRENCGIGVTELAKILKVTNSAATQLVNDLVSHGFLVRECDASDRRAFKIKLAPQIEGHISAIKKDSIKRMATVFSALDDDELDTFASLIKKIVEKY